MMESEVSFESALQKLKSMFDCPTEDGHPAKGTWCGNCREICEADGTNWCDRNWYLDDVLAVEEAHKREIEEIREKWMHQAAVIADGKHKLIDRLKRELAAKGAEIKQLRLKLYRVMDVTGDCRKCQEEGDESCPWYGEPCGCNNRVARDKFLDGELVDTPKAKDAEIAELRECLREAVEWSCGNPDEDCGDCVAHGGDTPCKCEKWRKALEGGTVMETASLRALVKEMADALNDATAIACKGEYCNKHSFCQDCQATKNRELVAKAREVCK